jgi:hypothetical protein
VSISRPNTIASDHPRQCWYGKDQFARLGILIAALVTAVCYILAYLHHPALPLSFEHLGWFKWFDQERYYNAAVAWAHGNLDPALHWYLPGYALMGAPFARFTPLHTFLVPNLICLLVSLWLFSKITARLAPDLPFSEMLGAIVFVGCTVFKPEILEVWVVPNSTSGSTPFIYGALLAALFFIDLQRPRHAFLAALCSCAVVAFRPSDAMPLLIAVGAGMALTLLRARPAWKQMRQIIAAVFGGATLSLGMLAFAYLSIYGFKESGYVWISKLIGFEWRLEPLRLVMLIIDPHPALMDGESLAARFPWIMPGLVGCITFIFFPPLRSRRLAECMIAGAALLHILIYCAYRDIHPINLIRFTQYHYFKWVLPILALYSIRLAWAIVIGPDRMRTVAVGIVTALLMFSWRVELHELPNQNGASRKTVSGNTIMFHADFSDVQNTILVAATNAASDSAGDTLILAGKKWGGLVDFRVYPQPSGLMLAVLRPLGSGDGALTLEPQIKLDANTQPVNARLQIIMGLPCLIWPERHACQATNLIRAPEFPQNGRLTFDGNDIRYQTTGWSFTQDGGQWTDGRLVGLRFRLKEIPPSSSLHLEIDANPYMPYGAEPLRVRLQVNSRPIEAWTFQTGDRTTLKALIPVALFQQDETINLSLRIDNPRSPHDASWESRDTRKLGLFVHSLKLGP